MKGITMNLLQLAERFENETARIEELFLLAGMVGSDNMPNQLSEFLADEVDDLGEIMGCKMPDYVIKGIEAEEWDSFSEFIYSHNKIGYMLKMATPIMQATSANSYRYSWGYYSTKWFYGDTLEEAIEAGFKWVATRREVGK